MKVNIIERVLIITISNFNESEERGTLRFHAGLYDSLEFRRFAWPCAPLHPPSMAEAVEQVDRVEQGALAGGPGAQSRHGGAGPARQMGVGLAVLYEPRLPR